MGLRSKLEDRIKRKEQEIQDLELEYQNKVLEAKSYIKGLQDALKLCPRDKVDGGAELRLKPGSLAQKTYDLLEKQGRPMHITEILTSLDREPTRSQKTSLAGSLAAYVRKHQLFEKIAPGTFALIGHSKKQDDVEPPDDFGEDSDDDNDKQEIDLGDDIPF